MSKEKVDKIVSFFEELEKFDPKDIEEAAKIIPDKLKIEMSKAEAVIESRTRIRC